MDSELRKVMFLLPVSYLNDLLFQIVVDIDKVVHEAVAYQEIYNKGGKEALDAHLFNLRALF